MISLIVLALAVGHVQASVTDFRNCIMAKMEPIREHCHDPNGPTCDHECLDAANDAIPKLDGSCCDLAADEASGDQVEECRENVKMQGDMMMSMVKEECPNGPELMARIMQTASMQFQKKTREDEIVNAFDNNDVSKLFSMYDKDDDKKLTAGEQDQFLSDLEHISFLELPESFKKKAKADHGMTKEEFSKKYSALTSEFQNIQKEAIKEDMKKELKNEVTELLADYDKDGDGKLSSTEQRQFLEDLQKIYSVDLSDELANTEQESQEEATTEQNLVAQDQDGTPSISTDIIVFFVSAFASAAFTSAAIHFYRKSKKVNVEDNYALLSA